MSESKLWPVSAGMHSLPDYTAITALPDQENTQYSNKLLHGLAGYNEHADTDSLAADYGWHLGKAEQALGQGMTPEAAAAFLGRLDFYIGSLIRHEDQAEAERPYAQHVLLGLGELAGTVPCGTVFTYAASDKWGFIGSLQEATFIGQVREHIEIMDLGIAGLLGALHSRTNLESPDPQPIRRLDDAARRMHNLAAHQNASRHDRPWKYDSVSVDYFLGNIQRFFGSANIGDKTYQRASGRHMSSLAFGNMVLGNMGDYPADYFDAGAQYLTPNHRSAVERFRERTNGRDVLTLVRDGELPSEFALAVAGLLRAEYVWRIGHKYQAKEAAEKRVNESSGAGTIEDLQNLSDIGLSAAEELEALAAA